MVNERCKRRCRSLRDINLYNYNKNVGRVELTGHTNTHTRDDDDNNIPNNNNTQK
jgi:hypothetical protein